MELNYSRGVGLGVCRLTVTLLLAGILFPGFCAVAKYSFIHEATSGPSSSYFDFIIIGGGTAGCALATTLSQGANVLVLERGGSPYGNPNVTEISNFASPFADNSPSSPSQQFISEDGVYNNRARVLGGGTCINAGFYSRASKEYVRKAGWDEDTVRESYEWVEKKVAFQPRVGQWQSAVKQGLLEAGVLPDNGFTYDHQCGTKIGGTIFDARGRRHTAADLLEYADAGKITVLLHATVHRILFSEKGNSRPRAKGVLFCDEKGVQHTASLANQKSEIIVSAGTLGSPQLLMLSGIGPAKHLQAHGIDVILDQPMVGQEMADNPMNALLIPSPLPVEPSLLQVVGITRSGSYIEAASAKYAYPWILSFITGYNGKQPSEAEAGAEGTNPLLKSLLNGGVILEKIIGPMSRGQLQLKSTNPEDNPSVTFNYFSDPKDLKRCVDGMKTIIDVINSKAFAGFRYLATPVQVLLDLAASLPINRRPRHLNSAFSLEQFCIDTVLSICHYHGGCQVGRVVDNDYNVLGVASLRVIDGSTFIDTPGTNPQATIMMLGRYMGQRILQERSSP